MSQRSAARPSEVAKAERPHAVHCVQCGEALDSKRITKLVEGATPVLCVDCAFDTIPCTD
jgi:hypothetical protein